jgi:hypothetical protein
VGLDSVEEQLDFFVDVEKPGTIAFTEACSWVAIFTSRKPTSNDRDLPTTWTLLKSRETFRNLQKVDDLTLYPQSIELIPSEPLPP